MLPLQQKTFVAPNPIENQKIRQLVAQADQKNPAALLELGNLYLNKSELSKQSVLINPSVPDNLVHSYSFYSQAFEASKEDAVPTINENALKQMEAIHNYVSANVDKPSYADVLVRIEAIEDSTISA